MQVTARSDRDLTPESIIQKVSDASGSKYSGGGSTTPAAGPPPPVSSKPAFTPTRSSGGGAGFNPLASSRIRSSGLKDTNVDEDGWGQDAPPVTRTQLEKVQSSYQPTKVNIRELNSQKQEPSHFEGSRNDGNKLGESDVVKGGYQPVGRVDIAALRREAQLQRDDRPTPVKGSYEPVGKVDIAAIRARAQQPTEETASPASGMSPAGTSTSSRSTEQTEEKRSLPDRSAPFSTSERLTSLPKPRTSHRFGSGTGSFVGTKAPMQGSFGLESNQTSAAPPVGVGRTFADQGGKTPAQLWAEKKARERGLSGASDNPPPGIGASAAPLANQDSGDWKSGYGGKSWAPVQTNQTGQSASSLSQKPIDHDDEESEEAVPSSPAGGVGAMRDRFRDAAPMSAANVGGVASAPEPPPLDTSSKPNAGRHIQIPGLPTQPSQQEEEEEGEEEEQGATRLPTPPAQPPRSPTPPTPPALDSGSPIQVAMPVGRGNNQQEVGNAREEQFSPPPPMPTRSLAQAIPHEDDLTEEPTGRDPARGAGEATAATVFGQHVADSAHPGAQQSGKRALVQYDYEKAEENELEMKEGEYVTNIEMVDDDWWMGQNPRGESGLFPSNYVELVEDNADADGQALREPDIDRQAETEPEPEQYQGSITETRRGATATALYDYEAAENNELSFPENAKITGVVSLLPLLICSDC